MFTDIEQVVEASIDLMDEVVDVDEPTEMLRHIVHRFGTQPDRMAQIVMCLSIWASGVPRSGLYRAANDLVIERARDRLKAGVGDIDAYMRVVQELRAS
ncbi:MULTISPECIES: hypothetical protein [Gordonia]|uniref:hypothetical protein n=1 Tax=Gordonia TaxID=2053 RepID=UPI00257F6A24|nr:MULTISPECIES: hypothetical protein [Gordonia]